MLNKPINKIYQNIHESDTVLNSVIADFIGSTDTAQINQWRIDNYALLRRWAYPNQADFNDAQVKLNSGVPELESEGQQQMDDYTQKCLNVKTRFPKE